MNVREPMRRGASQQDEGKSGLMMRRTGPVASDVSNGNMGEGA